MKKRILALALACVMALSLAACGSKKEETKAAETTAAETTAEETKAEEAASEEPITLNVAKLWKLMGCNNSYGKRLL